MSRVRTRILRGMLVVMVAWLISAPAEDAQATFYGEIPQGYRWVQKGKWGYGIYFPKNFGRLEDPGVIFAFGRTEDDYELPPERIAEYVQVWAQEAEKRGYVVVVPYWQPVLVAGTKFQEKYLLEILDEVMGMYNLNPKKALLTGYGLGNALAYAFDSLHQDEFEAIASVASSPMRDEVVNAYLDRLQWKRSKKPLLTVYAGSSGDSVEPWMIKENERIRSKVGHAELRAIQGYGFDHHMEASAVIMDWFEHIRQRETS